MKSNDRLLQLAHALSEKLFISAKQEVSRLNRLMVCAKELETRLDDFENMNDLLTSDSDV